MGEKVSDMLRPGEGEQSDEGESIHKGTRCESNEGPENVEDAVRLGDIESSTQDMTRNPKGSFTGQSVLRDGGARRFADRNETAVSSSGD